MRIGFDARMIDHPGIGRYIRNILKSMLSLEKRVEFIVFGDPGKLSEFSNIKIHNDFSGVYSFKELFFSRYKDEKLDVVHIPHFNAPFYAVKNLVVTVHDLIYLKVPETKLNSLKKFAAKKMIHNAISGAKCIIAVSENTKKDIIEYFPFAKDKIKVIYEAADSEFAAINGREELYKIKNKYCLSNDIILYVGSLKGHKNICRLIEAYKELKNKGVKHQLVLVGRCKDADSRILDGVKEEGVLYLGEVPQKDLAAIYHLSSLLVNPSLYEGFGLPVVEALACGVPVAVSSVSSLPEIAGDAGVYFNPNDSINMADTIFSAINNSLLREKLIASGKVRNKFFSWEKAASATLQVYKSVYTEKIN